MAGAVARICNTHLEGAGLKSRSGNRASVHEYTWSFSVYPVNTGYTITLNGVIR